MATQAESTYISESTTDIAKILTANLRFSTTLRMSLGDSNNDRQPEMAAETENAYISEIVKGIIQIFGLTMTSSIKVHIAK